MVNGALLTNMDTFRKVILIVIITVSYIGYLAGRFMVNLTDSLEKKDGMLNNADNFKYAGL